jgi:hypothetical protein
MFIAVFTFTKDKSYNIVAKSMVAEKLEQNLKPYFSEIFASN